MCVQAGTVVSAVLVVHSSPVQLLRYGMRSILSVLELPLGEVCLCAESTLWIFEAATGRLDLGGHEWGELWYVSL